MDRVLTDAWALYRLLFRRSVLTAALVFAVVQAVDVLPNQVDVPGLGLVAFLLGFAGPVIVQGALVEIVRNVHEGQRPEQVGRLYEAARRRFWSLLWASIVYAFGIFFGLIALIVPGLLAAARWCLMAPLIVLEGASAGDARHRSSALVKGHTGSVLGVLVVVYIGLAVPLLAINWSLGLTFSWQHVLAGFVWQSLTAPFQAHVLTVVYYRLTDPERPVIHPAVREWRSLWAES